MPDTIPWHQAPLVALDLEGTGAQDREHEAILELAIVPITNGHPDIDHAYETLLNPGRPVPRRPWISPGLTTQAVSTAPRLEEVADDITARIHDHYIVGHNISVDWRLLHRHVPDLKPAGLIDTLRLTRHLRPDQKTRSLTALTDQLGLTDELTRQVPNGHPHRALWDTAAAALLLRGLLKGKQTSLPELLHLAGSDALPSGHAQPTLWN